MKRLIRNFFLLFLTLSGIYTLSAEDGYDLWLRYQPVENAKHWTSYLEYTRAIYFPGNSPTILAAQEELLRGLNGLLGSTSGITEDFPKRQGLIIGTPDAVPEMAKVIDPKRLEQAGTEGYIIYSTYEKGKQILYITANEDIGILYGVFRFLQLLQTHQPISDISILSRPTIEHRLLNHWDNLDRTVERGYAGFSLWEWHTLPEYQSERYKDYARANASIGINGTAITNVNANAEVLTTKYLKRVASLAEVFRPYGIKVYLTARFSAPVEIGGLATADPLDEEVIAWWTSKVDEIYEFIPDFGGFLVKANSEGQPGPQNYNRSHAEGANLLARPLQKHGGIVMWRAFVYSNEEPEDRAKQAYNEFMPLDGKFEPNVLVQVKNGPIDFQPREPFHPLFGGMKETPLMMEFQVTQEYLGQGIHLTYLAPLYKECLDTDTYAKGEGSYVSKSIDGSLYNSSTTGMAGVSNIGNDINWCGHPIAQSNWFALGRLAWDPGLSSEQIAEEWIRMTYANDETIISPMLEIMMKSREAGVNYRTPLGLHHQMAWHHHYGPGPWIKDKPRADWTSAYYHRADKEGIGFDRAKTGSDAVSQYFPEVESLYGNIETCPEELLLWFHHVPWDYEMNSGRTLWEELCYKYYEGTDQVKAMQEQWNTLEGLIDQERFEHVQSLLEIQVQDAIEWRNACLLYYQTFSGLPIPDTYEQPDKTLEEYMQVERKYLPGS